MRTSSTRTKTATLTTTEAAVLALLAIEGEKSGYDLLKHVQKAIAYVWAPAKTQLYAVLPRLVDAGLARRREVAQTDRPDKHLYRITPKGKRSLQTWLEIVEPGAVETFYLRAFVGGLIAPRALIAHYEQFKHDSEERLAEYRAIEPTNSRRGHDFHHYLMLRFGIERAEQAVRWADWALGELRKKPR